MYTILLTKTTAAQNENALSYHRVRGLCFLAVVFAATISVNVFLIEFPLTEAFTRAIYTIII